MTCEMIQSKDLSLHALQVCKTRLSNLVPPPHRHATCAPPHTHAPHRYMGPMFLRHALPLLITVALQLGQALLQGPHLELSNLSTPAGFRCGTLGGGGEGGGSGAAT